MTISRNFPHYAQEFLKGFPVDRAILIDWANPRWMCQCSELDHNGELRHRHCRGLVQDSCWIVALPNGGQVVCYQSKLSVDCDGRTARRFEDPDAGTSTSLKDKDGRPFAADEFPYLVLPSANTNHNSSAFADENIELGDLAVSLWFTKRLGLSVKGGLYADYGPMKSVGEDSVNLVGSLGINNDPESGGQDLSSQRATGVCHIAFPGSRKLGADGRNLRTAEDVQADALELLFNIIGAKS